MVVLDLFPAGAIQFKAVVEQGLWYGRSHHFIENGTFVSLTWLRGIGASVFFFGGVIPLTWFIVTRIRHLKSWKPIQDPVDLESSVSEPELEEAY